MGFVSITMLPSEPDIFFNVKYQFKSDHKANKVAIVDWDVHHGDGTQHAFQKEKNIMLISIHRYDRGTFYPSN